MHACMHFYISIPNNLYHKREREKAMLCSRVIYNIYEAGIYNIYIYGEMSHSLAYV